MNRPSAYLLIATSWTLICPAAIAQEIRPQSGSQPTKSVALGTSAAITAPRMVLPASTNIRLKRSVKRKAKAAYPSSHYQKAMFFKQKHDKSRALVEFLKATQENPRLVKAYYEQALIFRERNYLKLAQSSLDQALAIKPDYQEARMLLATIQIQQGNVGAAMQQLGQSLGINVGTTNGEKDQDELPQPTVLQSLHMLLPERINREVAKLAGRKTNSATKPANKPTNKTELKAGRSKNKAPASSDNSATAEKSDGVQIAEPKNAGQNEAFGFHLPNPLHMFWPSDKNGETNARESSQPQTAVKSDHNTGEDTKEVPASIAINADDVSKIDANHLPDLPAAEKTPDSSENNISRAQKPSKKSKKSWFSRFLPVAEEQPEPPPAPPPIIDQAIATATAAGATGANISQPIDEPVQVETFDKPDESRQLVEKVTSMAQGAMDGISKIARNGFQIPNLPSATNGLFNTSSTANSITSTDKISISSPEAAKPYKPQIAPNSDDPWSVRLRYLADHGTGTLKDGEAFMFSEESGEATLFLSDGQTVRRTIYLPRDAQEVVKQRRPDILTPDDLLYNLSLLAKLMPKANEQPQQDPTVQSTTQQHSSAPNFQVNDLMGKSQSFWGWMKGALKL